MALPRDAAAQDADVEPPWDAVEVEYDAEPGVEDPAPDEWEEEVIPSDLDEGEDFPDMVEPEELEPLEEWDEEPPPGD